MHVDVKEYRDFYHHPTGLLAQKVIGDQIMRMWPSVSGLNLAGFGFATPYLSRYKEQTAYISAFMPAEQGVLIWPRQHKPKSTLVMEHNLPLADGCIDRLLIIHGLEMSASPYNLLMEAKRVLRADGEMVIVVPNRRSLWASLDTTPFGHGRPYSISQFRELCSRCDLAVQDYAYTLFTPPSPWTYRFSSGVEKISAKVWPIFGGAIVIKVNLDILRPVSQSAPVKVRGLFNPVPVRAARAS